MRSDARRSLLDRRLLPPPWSGAGALLAWSDAVDYADRYRGCLIGGAIGDALGRPAEGRPIDDVRRRFGELRDFVPWRGWRSGPTGTITDDTQLTMLVAETILAAGSPFDGADFARRLIGWLPVGRGKGRTCVAAVEALMDGRPWWEAGQPSAGNGAAMRAAPIGLRHATDPDRLRTDAALSAVVTHADGMAVASAVAQAAAVAWCLHCPSGLLEPARLVEAVVAALDGVHDPGHPERGHEAGSAVVRLVDRIAELPGLLHLSPEDAFARLYNGAFVLESLPAALWCFLRQPEDPEAVIVTAASGGRDADTVAAMAGNLVGAYHGERAFPARWTGDLEYAEELRRLADGLLAAAQSAGSTTGARRGSSSGRESEPDGLSRFRGCLLGGAVGDALGAPLEFLSAKAIDDRFGADGPDGYVPAYGHRGAITDDTQMTLFTAEGLIRAANRMADKGICDPVDVIRRAYQRWLFTQHPDSVGSDPGFDAEDGWLIRQSFLHDRRAPGNTCLSALFHGGRGTIAEPLNDSKGCGGVMRVAPVGLIVDDPFDLAADAAALTHGHPSGYLAAGALAVIVADLRHGVDLPSAVAHATAATAHHDGAAEVVGALEAAQAAAASGPDPAALAALGEGWVAEEALAISVYCALVATDFRAALLLAVRHGGDSDSTGAITGNILGAAWGVEAIPPDLLDGLEGRDVIDRIARDLFDATHHAEPDYRRYPPN